MLASTITVLCAFAALILVRNARKLLTKMVTVALALSSIIYLDPVIGVAPYGYLVFAFASIVASVEPSNSLNLRYYHKSFFVVTGVAIVLFAVARFLSFEEMVPKYFFGIIYVLTLIFFWIRDKRKLKSRIGILIVWLGEALRWIIDVF